jgi:hypothetical protein
LKRALIVLFVLLIALSMTVFTSAQEGSTSNTGVVVEEAAKNDIGILPGNPFYFLKEWGRNLKRSFISDPIKRAEFELGVLTEKGKELNKVSGLKFSREEAVEKAIQNYEESMAKLKERLEGLKSISNNPNVDELLKKLAERTQEHEQLFEDLSNKSEVFKERFKTIQGDWSDTVSPLFNSAGNLEQIKNKIMDMVGEDSPGYGAVLRIIERAGEEIKTEPGASAATSSEVISSDIQINENTGDYWTEEQMSGVKPHPMPSINSDKLDSIMLDIKKTFNIGQTKYAIQPSVCAEIYAPVCGEDGKTYSNECFATLANVNVIHEGACAE